MAGLNGFYLLSITGVVLSRMAFAITFFFARRLPVSLPYLYLGSSRACTRVDEK